MQTNSYYKADEIIVKNITNNSKHKTYDVFVWIAMTFCYRCHQFHTRKQHFIVRHIVKTVTKICQKPSTLFCGWGWSCSRTALRPLFQLTAVCLQYWRRLLAGFGELLTLEVFSSYPLRSLDSSNVHTNIDLPSLPFVNLYSSFPTKSSDDFPFFDPLLKLAFSVLPYFWLHTLHFFLPFLLLNSYSFLNYLLSNLNFSSCYPQFLPLTVLSSASCSFHFPPSPRHLFWAYADLNIIPPIILFSQILKDTFLGLISFCLVPIITTTTCLCNKQQSK